MKLEPARQFVNRTPEIDLVEARTNDLKKNIPVQYCIISFFGVPGIGKTSLLASLQKQYQEDEDFAIITLSVDKLSQFDLSVAKVRFLKLFTKENIISSEVRKQGQNLQDTADETHITDILNQITRCLDALPQPLLLIIDAWERAPEALFSWFERMLLLPLVRRNRFLCVLGSQAALRWRQFEVRRRVEAYQVRALDPGATQQQIDDVAPGALEPAVFALTRGHPFATEVVYQHLKAQPVTTDWAGWLETHQKELAQRVVDELFDRLLVEATAELRDIFRIMSLFREFNVHTLREILPIFNNNFKNRSQSSLLLALKHLSETRLVSWNDEIRAYQIDTTIRQIFIHALELSEPQLYRDIREAAISYYDGLIREVPANRNVYLVEYYYQCLYKTDSELYNEHAIRSSIETFVRSHYISPDSTYVDTQALRKLKAMFQRDQEIQKMLKESPFPPTIIDDTIQQFESS